MKIIIEEVHDMNALSKKLILVTFVIAVCWLLTGCANNYAIYEGISDALIDASDMEMIGTSQMTDIPETGIQDTIDVAYDQDTQSTESLYEPYDPEKEFDYLVYALKTFLVHSRSQFLMMESTYENKFDMAVYSGCALYVEFDPHEYYYVCAYSDSGHEYEFRDFCCIDGYTWEEFDHERDITDRHDGSDFVAAFQINKSFFCLNILSEGERSVDMEHYQIYTPEFVDGINTSSPLLINQSYLYFYSSDCLSEYHVLKTPYVIYHSKDCYYHKSVALPVVELDDKDFVQVLLNTTQPDGITNENKTLEKNFGKYYDDAMRLMITGKHSITDQDGTVRQYGLLGMEEISEIIKSQGEK